MVATAILCAFSVYEIYRATGTIENEVMFTVSMLIAVLAAFVHIPRSEIVLTVAFIFATVASIWLMIRQKHCSLDSPVKAFFIVLLIIVLFKAIPELRSLNSGLYYLIFAVTLCFVTDVAAYLIGRGLGRHKLMPKVSPNKTIEGSLGGLELLQFVRTAQKAPHVGDMKFKRSGAASAAPLRSLSGCARGCRSEYNDQSFHWLH